MSQAFYRKWRPHLWDQVVSQEHIVHTLQNAIRSGRVGHAYLFAGPRGTGKTSTARLLAKAVNCLDEDLAKRPCDQCDHCRAVNESRFLDLIEIDAASNTSVEDVRDLRDKINFAPSQGRFKVYIIDEIHMLSTAAFNALLKTLEEPPAHAIFLLATTEVHKIPATVLSRCQRHEFRRIPITDIANHLKTIAELEKLDADPEVFTLIARQSTGAMRDAISLLDQLASTGEKITLARAQDVLGTATNQVVVGLVTAILSRDPASGFNAIHGALDSGTDARQFARQIVEYLRSLLLVRMGNAEQVDATAEMRSQMAQHAQSFDLDHLLESIRLFNTAASDTKGSWQPGLLLELALAEAVEGPQRAAAVPSASAPVAAAPPPRPRASAEPPSAPPDWQELDPQPAAPQPRRSEPQTDSARPPAPQTTPKPASQAAPMPASADPPAAPPEGGTIGLQDLQHNWRRVRSLVKRKSMATEALLNSCKLLSIKENVLVLGFQTEVLRAKMASQENLEFTSSAISEVLGVQLGITCIVMNAKAGAAPTDHEVDSDGMVGTALNLGGQIVHKE